MVYASFSDTPISIDGFPLPCWIPMSGDWILSISVRGARGVGEVVRDPGHPKTPLELKMKTPEMCPSLISVGIWMNMGSKMRPSQWFQYVSELDTWTRGHAGNQDRPERMIKKCSHQVQAARFLFNSILVSCQPKCWLQPVSIKCKSSMFGVKSYSALLLKNPNSYCKNQLFGTRWMPSFFGQNRDVLWVLSPCFSLLLLTWH